MADTAYVIPGGGIVIDTKSGDALAIPGVGIYVEQEAEVVVVTPEKREGLLLGVY